MISFTWHTICIESSLICVSDTHTVLVVLLSIAYLCRRFEWVPVNGNCIVRNFLYTTHQTGAILRVCNNGRDSNFIDHVGEYEVAKMLLSGKTCF